jgi:predicted small lipoprotein YifL
MNRRIPSLILLFLITIALGACGSKGALVMPDQQATAKKKHAPKSTTPAPAPATTPSSDDAGKQ